MCGNSNDIKIIQRFPKGVVTPPPSKSIAHRGMICGALSEKSCCIENCGESLDVIYTRNVLRSMGFSSTELDNKIIFTGKQDIVPQTTAFCGESGSTLRFLLPIVAALGISMEFTGEGRLLQRPMDDYLQCLNGHGATIVQKENSICVKGQLQGGIYTIPGDISSQYITGLLMALPLLSQESTISVTTPLQSKPYVDLTLDVMKQFGVTVEHKDYQSYYIAKEQRYLGTNITVESDYSGGAFFLVASALGADVTVQGLCSNSLQGDREILQFLHKAGAKVISTSRGLQVKADNLTGFQADVGECPDLAPPLAALMCYCKGESKITNAKRLRYKESDRLTTIATELTRLGAYVEEYPDGLRILGRDRLKGGKVNAQGDHRIAMMLAVAAMGAENDVELEGYATVEKSYPRFWNQFEQVRKKF